MAKHPMPQEKQDRVKELVASGKTYTETGKVLGIARQTVSQIINPEQKKKQRERDRRYAQQRRDQKFIRLDREDLPPDCFNVNRYRNWLTGFGA